MRGICVTVLKSISPIENKHSYMAYIPAVVLTVGIAVLSLWERPYLPPPVLSLGDKVLHGMMYTVLAAAWMMPVINAKLKIKNSKLRIALWVVLGVTAYGALMEVLQRYCTMTRSGEIADVIADFVGAIVGVALVVVVHLLLRRK